MTATLDSLKLEEIPAFMTAKSWTRKTAVTPRPIHV